MSYAAPARARSAPVLPLAALVDILFLLLVFFLTLSAFRESEKQIPVNLPTAASGIAEKAPPINITVLDDGTIMLGSSKYEMGQLRLTLKMLAEQAPGRPVVIRGDQSSNYGLIVQILDMAREQGMPASLGVARKTPAP